MTGLAPSRHVLPNGVRVLFKRTTTTPAVTLHLSLDCGSLHDPVDQPGLAHFVSRTIDRGTEARTTEQIAEDLDGWGVSLQTGVSRHTLVIGCTCLAEDFPRVLALVADVVRRPSFPEPEVQTRRGEILTLIQQDEDSPATVATDVLMAMLYGEAHPYGLPLRGRTATVKAMDRAALRSFHRNHVTPAGTCVAVVGDVDPDDAMATLVEAFGDWPPCAAPAVTVPTPPAAGARRTRVVPMMNKSQADVAYGFTGITRADPDYYAWWLMNTVLGEYALGGRLGDNIRERQGMAYYVSSSLGAGPIAGPLLVRAGVSADNVQRTIEAIDAELRHLAADGPTEQEVNESRQYLIGSLPRHLETNAGIAEYLQSVEFFGLGLDHDIRLADLLGRVTRDDVHAAASKALDPTRAAVVVAGPFDGPLS
ncbi:MAG TPA: pitrilysin family protein [Vicinamibacterales bacterium]